VSLLAQDLCLGSVYLLREKPSGLPRELVARLRYLARSRSRQNRVPPAIRRPMSDPTPTGSHVCRGVRTEIASRHHLDSSAILPAQARMGGRPGLIRKEARGTLLRGLHISGLTVYL